MPMTAEQTKIFEETRDLIIKTHRDVGLYWRGWSPNIYSEGNWNIGMLPLFLADERKKIKKAIGGRTYYKLLDKVAGIARKTDEQSMILTPDIRDTHPDSGYPLYTINPLYKAIDNIVDSFHFGKADMEAALIILKHTPDEGIIQKDIFPKTTILTYGLHRRLSKKVILEIISRLTDIKLVPYTKELTNSDAYVAYRKGKGLTADKLQEIIDVLTDAEEYTRVDRICRGVSEKELKEIHSVLVRKIAMLKGEPSPNIFVSMFQSLGLMATPVSLEPQQSISSSTLAS